MCPISSTIKTLLCDAAVVCIQSIAFVAISTADWNPKLISVSARSLSIVFGRVRTFSPFSLKRLAVLCEPLPPRTTRQSRYNFLYVSIILSILSEPSSSGTPIYLKGILELPRIVPPMFKIPEKSSFFNNLYSP